MGYHKDKFWTEIVNENDSGGKELDGDCWQDWLRKKRESMGIVITTFFQFSSLKTKDLDFLFRFLFPIPIPANTPLLELGFHLYLFFTAYRRIY